MREFDDLYKEYSEGIFKYLIYLTGSKSSAEELLQETFFQAFKSINRFKGESKISTWLYSIARNVYLKQYSKNKKYNICELNELSSYINPQDLLETNYERKETLREVLKKISNLDFDSRQVILFRVVNELSFKDIGDILGKSENWARVTFHRVKVRLRKEIEL